MIAPQRALEHLGDLGLEPAAADAFLGANARAVFGL